MEAVCSSEMLISVRNSRTSTQRLKPQDGRRHVYCRQNFLYGVRYQVRMAAGMNLAVW
jgi:hypothetical protein